jgi:hypothetical protein
MRILIGLALLLICESPSSFTGFRLYAAGSSTSSLASVVATSAGKASAYASTCRCSFSW